MRLILGSIIGAAALWLAFRGESLDALLMAIRQADPAWTLAALGSVFASLGVVTIRWQVLFERTPRPGPLFNAMVVGQAINIALPIRVGEIVRVALVRRTTDQTIPHTFMTVVVERLMDTGMVAIAAAWLAMQVVLPPGFSGPVRALTIAGTLAGAIGAALIVFGKGIGSFLSARVDAMTHRGIARFARYGATAAGEAGHLRDPGTLAWALVLSGVVLLLSALTNYLLFRAFHLAVPPAAALVVLLGLQIGSAPVSTPGNLGVFQYVTVLVLGMYDVSRTAAVAYSMVLYVVAYGPKLVGGAWLLGQAANNPALFGDVKSILRGRQ